MFPKFNKAVYVSVLIYYRGFDNDAILLAKQENISPGNTTRHSIKGLRPILTNTRIKYVGHGLRELLRRLLLVTLLNILICNRKL